MIFLPRKSHDPRIYYPEEGHPFPYLMHFIATNFNQDWDYETNDPDEIVREYGRDGHPEDLVNVQSDIRRFLAAHATTGDDELSAIFGRMFDPGEYFWLVKGRSLREGLLEVIRILSVLSPGPSNNP